MELQTKFPIGSYWCDKKSEQQSIEHYGKYCWIQGYELFNKDSKDVMIKSQIISYTNNSWYMKNNIGRIYEDNLIPCTKIDFLKTERNIERGFSLIKSMVESNKIHSTEKFQIKNLEELKSGDKFLYFLVDGTVIRFGEMKGEFKSFNGKYDDTYNSTMRQMTLSKKLRKIIIIPLFPKWIIGF